MTVEARSRPVNQGWDMETHLTDQTEPDSPLERYLRLLEIIAAFPDQLALADVAALSDLPKTTAHRLLKGLVKAELASGGQGGRAYSVGPRLSRILHATADDGWLEALPAFLGAVDDSVAKEALKLFTKQGLKIHLGVKISAVKSGKQGVAVGSGRFDVDNGGQAALFGGDDADEIGRLIFP